MKYKLLIISLLSINCFAQKIETKNISNAMLENFNKENYQVEKAIQFNDKNGLNYLIIRMKELRTDNTHSKTLFVQHFIEEKFKIRLLRQITDFELDCEFDNDLQFIDKSLTISDLDKNNYAEISFLYKVGCRSDVSPIGLKLMVLENGNKAAIRGKTIPRNMGFKDEKTADEAFKKLPKIIQDQAYLLWKNFAPEF